MSQRESVSAKDSHEKDEGETVWEEAVIIEMSIVAKAFFPRNLLKSSLTRVLNQLSY
jgi:hypothetical protein